MLDFKEIFLCGQLAVLCYVLFVLLMREGQILEWYYDILVRVQIDECGKKRKFGFLAKPLGLCELCAGGQIAFWIWLYGNICRYKICNLFWVALEHLIFTTTTILFIFTLKNLLKKWK